VKLDQALFGYKEGHRRVASSNLFQPGDERFLVRMTDLSGSRMVSGFEEYLSGYILPSGAAYAFAKTWYAPECERPGCVWTHVLFISPGDWESLTPEELFSLFKRPEVERPSFSYYTSAIGPTLPVRSFRAPIPNRSVCADLLEGLYSDSLPLICVADDGGARFELLMTKIIWQRPLALRSTLSFCTGALNFLRDDNDPIRVQVMPTRVAKATREEALKLTPSEERRAHDSWVDLLVKDLFDKDPVFRVVLNSFKVDSSPVNESGAVELMQNMAQLCVFYDQFESGHIATTEMLEELATVFPLASAQIPFKKKALGRATKTRNGQGDIVRFALSHSNQLDSYANLKTIITDAAASVSREDPSSALRLLKEHLFTPRINAISEGVIEELLKCLNVRDLRTSPPVDSQILYALAQQQPQAISEADFWLLQQSFEESSELADLLVDRLGENVVLSALLSAGRFDLLLRMLRLQGASGAFKAFFLARSLRLEDEVDYRKLIALRDELTDYSQTLSNEIGGSRTDCDSAQLFLLASLNIDPSTLAHLAPDIEIWQEAVSVLPLKLERIHAVATFLVCGDEFPEAWRLASRSFDLVHDAIAGKSFPLDWWWILKTRLPSLGMWEKWDNCERLRRGLVDTFLRNGWPPEKLRSCTHDDLLYEKLLKTYLDRAS
jgi:hypothetical protein